MVDALGDELDMVESDLVAALLLERVVSWKVMVLAPRICASQYWRFCDPSIHITIWF